MKKEVAESLRETGSQRSSINREDRNQETRTRITTA